MTCEEPIDFERTQAAEGLAIGVHVEGGRTQPSGRPALGPYTPYDVAGEEHLSSSYGCVETDATVSVAGGVNHFEASVAKGYFVPVLEAAVDGQGFGRRGAKAEYAADVPSGAEVSGFEDVGVRSMREDLGAGDIAKLVEGFVMIEMAMGGDEKLYFVE